MAVPAVHPSMFAMIGIVSLVLWRIYSRVRRMVGRQTLRPRRLGVTLVVFPALLALLMLTSIVHPLNALYLVSGATIGALLGLYGLRLTRFEVADSGLFYTPNAHLGIALSLVFIGRIVYRLLSTQTGLSMSVDASAPAPISLAGSPLTLLIFATLAGYYVSYAIGLLRWSRTAKTSVIGDDAPSEKMRIPRDNHTAEIGHVENSSLDQVSDPGDSPRGSGLLQLDPARIACADAHQSPTRPKTQP